MQNLYDASDREALMRRVSALQQTNARQWGKMNAAQMLAHCAAALEVACGDPIRKQAFIGRVLAPFVKSTVLGEKPFSRNGPTDPAFKIVDDRDFSAERQRLTDLVERFASRGPSGADGLVHSFFGRLRADEWSRLMYKHLDHHLRQFGA
jgi:uncharacterized protein DUF1569